ncbi:MAG: phosphoadenosine phosphosulfate reductase family protein [Pseudomonadota bacterium]
MNEPVLNDHDRACWVRLELFARMHARSREHQRRVAAALRVTERALKTSRLPSVSWSAGKDSTALSALVLSVDPTVELASEKDDLDYPGEEEYVTQLAARWGAQLTILRPPVSPSQWISENRDKLAMGDDFHSRAAGLSKACFYNVMTEYDRTRDLVFLGLRAEESVHRQKARAANGIDYVRRDGIRICTPIADWTGIDVFAFLFAREIDPLHVYRCIGFMHEREPWRLRKSWWIPGDRGKHGGATWLRRYYPSLFQRLLEWFPRARSFA